MRQAVLLALFLVGCAAHHGSGPWSGVTPTLASNEAASVIVVAWVEPDDVAIARSFDAEHYGVIRVPTGGRTASRLTAATSPDGHVAVAWTSLDENTQRVEVHLALAPPAGPFEDRVVAGAGPNLFRPPALAMMRTELLLAYDREDHTHVRRLRFDDLSSKVDERVVEGQRAALCASPDGLRAVFVHALDPHTLVEQETDDVSSPRLWGPPRKMFADLPADVIRLEAPACGYHDAEIVVIEGVTKVGSDAWLVDEATSLYAARAKNGDGFGPSVRFADAPEGAVSNAAVAPNFGPGFVLSFRERSPRYDPRAHAIARAFSGGELGARVELSSRIRGNDGGSFGLAINARGTFMSAVLADDAARPYESIEELESLHELDSSSIVLLHPAVNIARFSP